MPNLNFSEPIDLAIITSEIQVIGVRVKLRNARKINSSFT